MRGGCATIVLIYSNVAFQQPSLSILVITSQRKLNEITGVGSILLLKESMTDTCQHFDILLVLLGIVLYLILKVGRIALNHTCGLLNNGLVVLLCKNWGSCSKQQSSHQYIFYRLHNSIF